MLVLSIFHLSGYWDVILQMVDPTATACSRSHRRAARHRYRGGRQSSQLSGDRRGFLSCRSAGAANSVFRFRPTAISSRYAGDPGGPAAGDDGPAPDSSLGRGRQEGRPALWPALPGPRRRSAGDRRRLRRSDRLEGGGRFCHESSAPGRRILLTCRRNPLNARSPECVQGPGAGFERMGLFAFFRSLVKGRPPPDAETISPAALRPEPERRRNGDLSLWLVSLASIFRPTSAS